MRGRDWLLIPFLVAVAVICVGWGGWTTYRALRNTSPVTLTCEQLLAHPPAADWVHVEGCVAALDRMAVQSLRRDSDPSNYVLSPTAVYIPLRASEFKTGPTALLLAVESGPILALGKSGVTDAEQQAAADALARPFEGLIERALDRSARSRDKLRTLGIELTDDFLVIDYGRRPRPLWLTLGVLGFGIGALALLVRKRRRRKRPVEIARATVVSS